MLEAQAAQFDKDAASNTDFSYIKCGFEVEFASRFSRADIGSIIRDFTGSYAVTVSNKHGASHGGLYNKFSVESDGSIDTDRVYKVPVEIVSPILGFDEMLRYLERTLDMVATRGRTDSSTGLHISFSRNDVHLQNAKFDPLKLLLFLGEHYWAKIFGRERSTFAAQILTKVDNAATEFAVENKQVVTYKDCVDAVAKFSSVGWRELARSDKVKGDFAQNIARAIARVGRTSTVNLDSLLTPNGDRVEFRLMGGAGYHHKFDLIATLCKRFAYAMWASCSEQSNRYNQEYARKLYRLIKKNAGNATITEEKVSSVYRLRKTGDDRTNKLTVYNIDNLYKYRGQVGAPSVDSIAVIAFDKSGKLADLYPLYPDPDTKQSIFEAFRDGKLMDPTGKPLGMADLFYSLSLKNSDSGLEAFCQEWFDGTEKVSSLKDCLPRLHSIEPILVQKYGKMGARQMARVVSYLMTTNILYWLAGSHIQGVDSSEGAAIQAIISNNYSEIKTNIDIYREYVARYRKFMDEGVTVDSLFFLNSKVSEFIQYVVNGTEWSSEKYMVKISRSLGYPAVIAVPYGRATCFAVQFAEGRYDLATASSIRTMWTNLDSYLIQGIRDWSFLDARVIKQIPTLNATSRVVEQLARNGESPTTGLAYQYMLKAGKDAQKKFISDALLYVNPIDFVADPALDKWYAETGVPLIDKASKSLFSSRLMDANSRPVASLLDVPFPQKADFYSFLSRASDLDIASMLKSSAHTNRFVKCLCSISATTAEVPVNPAIDKAIQSDVVRRAFFVNLMTNTQTIVRDIYGVDHLAYIESLLDPSFGEFKIPSILAMHRAGLSEEFVLGDKVASLFIATGGNRHQGHALADALYRMGILSTDNDGRYVASRKIASPLIAAVLKKDKSAASDTPALAQLLPDGYTLPARRRA